MKFVKKSDCTIKNGYIVANGEIIDLPCRVRCDIKRLNYEYQAAVYNANNRPETPKKVEEFKPMLSFADRAQFTVEAKTPLLDAKIEEAKKIAEEISDSCMADKLNGQLNWYKELAMFVSEDEFVATDIIDERLGIDPEWDIFNWTLDDLKRLLGVIATFGGKPFNQTDTDPGIKRFLDFRFVEL